MTSQLPELQQAGLARGGPSGPKYEPTLLLSCLDCLSGLVEALGASSEPLVASFNLMALVLECCRDENPGVRCAEMLRLLLGVLRWLYASIAMLSFEPCLVLFWCSGAVQAAGV